MFGTESRGAEMVNLIAPMFLQDRYEPHFTNIETESDVKSNFQHIIDLSMAFPPLKAASKIHIREKNWQLKTGAIISRETMTEIVFLQLHDNTTKDSQVILLAYQIQAQTRSWEIKALHAEVGKGQWWLLSHLYLVRP